MKKICIALSPTLFLIGCGQSHTSQNGQQPATDRLTEPEPQAGPDAATADVPASANPPPGVNDGSPDLTPPQLIPEAERGEKGARNLLLSFVRAIELKEFDQAWAMLGAADRNKWSKSRFAALFSDLSEITVAMPGGSMEGAAGSLYYTAPLTITASDKDSRPVRLEGTAVLRRVNDLAGASAAKLRWHFEKVTLDWTH